MTTPSRGSLVAIGIGSGVFLTLVMGDLATSGLCDLLWRTPAGRMLTAFMEPACGGLTASDALSVASRLLIIAGLNLWLLGHAVMLALDWVGALLGWATRFLTWVQARVDARKQRKEAAVSSKGPPS